MTSIISVTAACARSDHRRGLAEAVPLGHGESQGQEVPGDDRIQARAAAAEDAQAAAELPMDRSEEYPAEVHADGMQGARKAEQALQQEPDRSRAPADLVEDPIVP